MALSRVTQGSIPSLTLTSGTHLSAELPLRAFGPSRPPSGLFSSPGEETQPCTEDAVSTQPKATMLPMPPRGHFCPPSHPTACPPHLSGGCSSGWPRSLQAGGKPSGCWGDKGSQRGQNGVREGDRCGVRHWGWPSGSDIGVGHRGWLLG